MDNLKLYNIARTVPNEAKKPIAAGRLKGFTDINPMWRIKRLTEMFGPCGVGWWYEITDKEMVEDPNTEQTAVFMDILLYYVDPETGAASHGIPGAGGSSFVAKERNGPYMSDECYKMALTDAISVAAKALGIGADVYYDKDRSKYNNVQPEPDAYNGGDFTPVCADCGATLSVPEHDFSVKKFKRPLCRDCQNKGHETKPAEATKYRCIQCGEELKPYKDAKGVTIGLRQHAEGSRMKYGDVYCLRCIKKKQAIEAVEKANI